MMKSNSIAMPAAIVLALSLTIQAQAAPPVVTQSGSGFLTVNGSGSPDDIRLRGLGSGTIKVIDIAAGDVAVGTYSGVSGVKVNLKGGANRVALTDVDIPDTLTINGGSDKDTIRVNGMLTIGGFLKIALAGGNNSINGNADNVTSITVGLNATVDTGGGKDTIGLTALSAKHVTIKAGGGNDKITLEGHSSITSRLIVNAGPGKNEIKIADTMANVAQVFSGSSEDEVWVINTQIADFIDVITGGGNDEIMTDTSTAANEYRINCGPGDDTLTDGGAPNVVVDCETVQAPLAFSRYLGVGVCAAGHRLATFLEAQENNGAACAVLGLYDIVRIADDGSMDGAGYGCGVRATDTRGLGASLCVNRP